VLRHSVSSFSQAGSQLGQAANESDEFVALIAA
jgi:hypothetical protein